MGVRILIFPILIILIIFISNLLVLVNKDSDLLELNSGDDVLLLLEFLLEKDGEIIELFVLFKAVVGLHEGVASSLHVSLHCIGRLEVMGALVVAGDAEVANFYFLLQVFDQPFDILAELLLGDEEAMFFLHMGLIPIER